MANILADDARQSHAFGFHVGRHDVRRLLLAVFVAVVGNHRDVEEVHGIVRRVGQVQQFFFEPRQLDVAACVAEKVLGFRETGSGRDRRKIRPVMRPDVPRRRPAHAEASYQNPVVIHIEVLLHVGQRFEKVHLTGECTGVAIPPVQVQNNCVPRRKLSGVVHTIPEEIHLAEGFGSTMEPGIHAPFMGLLRTIGGRHHEAIRLHTAIELRHITPYLQPRCGSP